MRWKTSSAEVSYPIIGLRLSGSAVQPTWSTVAAAGEAAGDVVVGADGAHDAAARPPTSSAASARARAAAWTECAAIHDLPLVGRSGHTPRARRRAVQSGPYGSEHRQEHEFAPPAAPPTAEPRMTAAATPRRRGRPRVGADPQGPLDEWIDGLSPTAIHVVEAGRRVLVADGYEAVTIERVAQEATVSPPTVRRCSSARRACCTRSSAASRRRSGRSSWRRSRTSNPGRAPGGLRARPRPADRHRGRRVGLTEALAHGVRDPSFARSSPSTTTSRAAAGSSSGSTRPQPRLPERDPGQPPPAAPWPASSSRPSTACRSSRDRPGLRRPRRRPSLSSPRWSGAGCARSAAGSSSYPRAVDSAPPASFTGRNALQRERSYCVPASAAHEPSVGGH